MLGQISKQQLPFATATAINDLAFRVQRAERANMRATFKNPRPFTANSTLVDRANKSNLTASVFVRPDVAKYLAPYEFGGLHVLPGRALLDPKGIKLDPYGQLPYRTMAQLRGRKDIYIGTIQTKSGPVNGVWQRVSLTRGGGARRTALAGARMYDPDQGKLRLLIRFGQALPVREHLGFAEKAEDIVHSDFREAFGAAIGKALATAR